MYYIVQGALWLLWLLESSRDEATKYSHMCFVRICVRDIVCAYGCYGLNHLEVLNAKNRSGVRAYVCVRACVCMCVFMYVLV